LDVQIKTLLLIVGIGNGLFLTVALMRIARSSRSSARYLTYLLSAFTLLLIIELLDVTLNWLIVPIPVGLLLGPLTYLYVRATIHSDSRFAHKDILHLLPSLLALILFFGIYLQNLGNWRFELFLDYNRPSIILQRISLLGYPLAAIWMLVKNRSTIRSDHLADAKMLITWLLLFLGVILALTLNSFSAIRELVGDYEQDMIGVIAVVVLVHTLGYMVVARRSLQDGFTKPRTTSLNDGEVRRIASRIHDWLQAEKQYLDPDMSLDMMSGSLNLPRNMISDVLNVGLGSSFYDVINSYRIEDFKQLAALPENTKKSVLELAFACGFNSKAAFYRAFKSIEGATPTAYRQAVDQNSN
jgi:AraC-like DNA-binding protein